MRIRRDQERGLGDFGWLKARYTFSFSRYFNKNWIGSGPLLVMNEDQVAGHKGFPPHSHEDMEILTLILKGTLTHQDSMGNKEHIKENEVQLMRAGSGVTHSEMNDQSEKVHLYQIWIEPKTLGLDPKYQQKKLDFILGSWEIITDSLEINQDMKIKHGIFKKGTKIKIKKGWLQVIDGLIEIKDDILNKSDGVELDEEVEIVCKTDARLLSFEF